MKTPQEINRAAAEAMEWEDVEIFQGSLFGVRPCETRTMQTAACLTSSMTVRIKSAVPNFYASRDACSQFERALSEDERGDYADILAKIVYADEVNIFNYVTATAPQRCAAFLELKSQDHE